MKIALTLKRLLQFATTLFLLIGCGVGASQNSGQSEIKFVAAPVFSPLSGVYASTQVVSITSPTAGAKIRYTTGQEALGPNFGILYFAPLPVASSSTLRAVAYIDEQSVSEVTSATYVITTEKAEIPVFSPPPGTYHEALSVAISSPTQDASILYTTDLSDPSGSGGNLYNGPVTVSSTTTLKAVAQKEGILRSDVQSAAYKLTAATPSFSLVGSTVYPSSQALEIKTGYLVDSIVFTTDGSKPSKSNGTNYEGPIQVGETGFFRAVAFSGNLEPSAEASLRVAINGSMTADIVSPGVNASSQNTNVLVYFNVDRASGVFPILTGVSAQVQDRRTTLLEDESKYYCDEVSCHYGFFGTLDLSGLWSGSYLLTVEAANDQGFSSAWEKTFTLDRPPVLNFQSPSDGAIETGSFPILAQCEDEDPATCRITVWAGYSFPGDLCDNKQTSGYGQLSVVFDMGCFEGGTIDVEVTARDKVGNQVTETRTVTIDSGAAALPRVETVEGNILDASAERIFYVQAHPDGDTFRMLDRSTGVTQTAPLSGRNVASERTAKLTPTGALFIATDATNSFLPHELFEWTTQGVESLGAPNSPSFLQIAGEYALWSEGTTLKLRNLSLKTTTVLSTNAGNTDNGLSDSGAVAYWSSVPEYQIHVVKNGNNTKITADSYWNIYPKFDGETVVYQKRTPCCSNQQYALAMSDMTTETLLSSWGTWQPRWYMVNNGWLAYLKEQNVTRKPQVWRRTPDGTISELTFGDAVTELELLTTDGSISYKVSSVRKFIDSTGNITSAGTHLGKPFRINGKWYVAINGTLLTAE